VSTNSEQDQEAEVNSGILNVGFGGVGNHGVTKSEAAYIERGATHSSYASYNHFTYIIFFRFPGRKRACCRIVVITGKRATCGKINQEVKPMCANADKTVHLKTLIAEIKALYVQWKKNRVPVRPTALPIR